MTGKTTVRRWFLCLGVSGIMACSLSLTGCSRQGRSGASVGTFAMGERVQVGSLVYMVLDAEWQDQLGEGVGARTPQHRFKVIRLSVTNSGIREADIPPMHLVAADGREYAELTEGAGVPEWLGTLRPLRPAATEHGRVLFDVPSGSYRLRVASLGEGDQETTALILIPFQVAPPAQFPLPGAQPR